MSTQWHSSFSVFPQTNGISSASGSPSLELPGNPSQTNRGPSQNMPFGYRYEGSSGQLGATHMPVRLPQHRDTDSAHPYTRHDYQAYPQTGSLATDMSGYPMNSPYSSMAGYYHAAPVHPQYSGVPSANPSPAYEYQSSLPGGASFGMPVSIPQPNYPGTHNSPDQTFSSESQGSSMQWSLSQSQTASRPVTGNPRMTLRARNAHSRPFEDSSAVFSRRRSHDRYTPHARPTSADRRAESLISSPRPVTIPPRGSDRADRSISPRPVRRGSYARFVAAQHSRVSPNESPESRESVRARRPNRASSFTPQSHQNVPTPAQMRGLRDQLRHLLPPQLPEGTSPACDICSKDYSEKHVDPTEDEEVAVQLPCKHIFGEFCINTWFETAQNPALKTKVSCPMCRKVFIEPATYSGLPRYPHLDPAMRQALRERMERHLVAGTPMFPETILRDLHSMGVPWPVQNGEIETTTGPRPTYL